MPSITLLENVINYNIQYSEKRRTICLPVDKENGVVITVPHDTKEDEIESTIIKKQTWVFKKLYEIQKLYLQYKQKNSSVVNV